MTWPMKPMSRALQRTEQDADDRVEVSLLPSICSLPQLCDECAQLARAEQEFHDRDRVDVVSGPTEPLFRLDVLDRGRERRLRTDLTRTDGIQEATEQVHLSEQAGDERDDPCVELEGSRCQRREVLLERRGAGLGSRCQERVDEFRRLLTKGRDHEVVLACEVVVQQAVCHLCLAGDLPRGQARSPVRCEQALGDVDEVAAQGPCESDPS